MTEPSLLLLFTRRLKELGLRYMISGGAAAIVYGEPRLTNDVDLVVILGRDRIARLHEAFPPDEYYCPPPEAIQIEAARQQRGHINIIHLKTGFKADIYLSGQDPMNLWGLERARMIEVAGELVSVASPEYVILRKLEYFQEGRSEKHIRDIRSMLASSFDQIDLLELEKKIAERGLDEAWQIARRDISIE